MTWTLLLLWACSDGDFRTTTSDSVAETVDTGDSSTSDSGTSDSGTSDSTCDTAGPGDTDEEQPTAAELCVLPKGALAVLASDTFTRDDSSDLGRTEVGGLDYVEPNTPGTDYARLIGEVLQLHYFADAAGSAPDQYIDLAQLAVADAVIDVSIATYSDGYDNKIGVSWRLPEQENRWSSGGYHAFIEHGTMKLLAGRVLLDETEVPDDHGWHDYRVVTVGDAHCVYRDELLVLSARDGTYPRAGYTGVSTWYSIASFDDWSVAEHPAPVSDTPGLDTLDGVQADHFELQLTTSSTDTVQLHYRGGETDGYVLTLAPDRVALALGRATLGSVDLAPPVHDPTWRLSVSGHAHRLLRDGLEVLQVSDGNVVAAGELGLLDGSNATDLGLRVLASQPIYPLGEAANPGSAAFPVMYYSVDQDRLPEVPATSLVHTYGSVETQQAFAETAAVADRRTMAQLGTYYADDDDPQDNSVEAEVRAMIERLSAGPSVGWWGFPEELRYWRENEVTEGQNLLAWTREFDPHQAPTFMYNPNHRTAEALAEVVPWLDVIGKGSYADYAEQPRAWVRYQLESTVEAIVLAGAAVGPDYLAGEKVPILVAGLWPDYPASAEELYHDVWSAIASGAHGISLFSHYYGLDPASGDGMTGFRQAGAELTEGEHPVGMAVLHGTALESPGFEISSGPTQTEAFTPVDVAEPIQYDCLNLRGWEYDGLHTVVAVNSCTEAVTATLTGLSTHGQRDVETPFEGRRLCAVDGALEDSFEPLGVHVYRLAP